MEFLALLSRREATRRDNVENVVDAHDFDERYDHDEGAVSLNVPFSLFSYQDILTLPPPAWAPAPMRSTRTRRASSLERSTTPTGSMVSATLLTTSIVTNIRKGGHGEDGGNLFMPEDDEDEKLLEELEEKQLLARIKELEAENSR